MKALHKLKIKAHMFKSAIVLLGIVLASYSAYAQLPPRRSWCRADASGLSSDPGSPDDKRSCEPPAARPRP